MCLVISIAAGLAVWRWEHNGNGKRFPVEPKSLTGKKSFTLIRVTAPGDLILGQESND